MTKNYFDKPMPRKWLRKGKAKPKGKRKEGLTHKDAVQVRQLIKERVDESDNISLTLSDFFQTVSRSLTSFTAGWTGLAADGSGVVDKSGQDFGVIKGVYLRGHVKLVTTNVTGVNAVSYRRLIVNFIKPITQPSATGALPAITEVLEADAFDSLPLSRSENASTFKILSDRTTRLGSNILSGDPAGYGQATGPQIVHFNEYVKLNVKQSYADHALNNGGLGMGGHYDSDNTHGRVTKNLLVMFMMVEGGGGTANTAAIDGNMRIVYA